MCFSSSASWLDYDGDGRLDLFVCNYVTWSPVVDKEVFFSLDGKERRRVRVVPRVSIPAPIQAILNNQPISYEEITVFDPATRSAGQIARPVEIIGTVRWPDSRHWFTPADDAAHNLFFLRDPAAIAAAKHLGAVAPFYVEQEAPVPPDGLPKPGKLVVALPDNHLQYAMTWYGLAATLVAVFAIWAWNSRRNPRREAAPPSL